MSKFTKLWFSIFNRGYSTYYSEWGVSSTFLLGRQYTFTSKPLCPTRFSKLRKFPSFLAQLLRRAALCLLIRHVNGFPLRKKLWKHMKIYWISIIMEVPLNSVVILKRRLPTELKSAVWNVQPFFNCTDTLLFSFCLGLMIFFPLRLFILDIPLTQSQHYPAFVPKQIYLVIGPGPDVLQLRDWIKK